MAGGYRVLVNEQLISTLSRKEQWAYPNYKLFFQQKLSTCSCLRAWHRDLARACAFQTLLSFGLAALPALDKEDLFRTISVGRENREQERRRMMEVIEEGHVRPSPFTFPFCKNILSLKNMVNHVLLIRTATLTTNYLETFKCTLWYFVVSNLTTSVPLCKAHSTSSSSFMLSGSFEFSERESEKWEMEEQVNLPNPIESMERGPR